MTRVTEAHSKSRRLLRSANQTPELMTGAARRDASPVCLRAWRMTRKTGDVRIHSRWNRKPNAATIPPVTSGTGGATVLRMIEPRIETAQSWKRFDLSTLSVRVTDRADLARRI